MIVYLDCRLLSNKPTGISRYTEQLIKFYCQLDICSTLVLIVNSNHERKYDNVKYLNSDLSPFRFFDCIKFSFFLNRHNLDLLHSPFYSSVFFNKKFKKIVSVMDLMYRIIPNYFSSISLLNFIKVKYFDLIVFFSLRNSSFLISISKSTEKDLKNFFNLKSTTIKLGFTNLHQKRKISNEISNLKTNEFYFYVGNNRKQKNLNFLIDSFLKSKSIKKLVIVGCKVNIDNKNIINFNSVNESELAYLYKSCYCFVFPSLYEGFGIPIVEAISFDCKILLSNAGSLIEFSDFGLNYFDPKNQNQLIHYFDNEHLIVDGKNYELIKEIYNWDNYFNILEEQINKIF